MGLEKLAVEAPLGAARLLANTLKETWSILDAAAEKPAPSRYLSRQAMNAVQGVQPAAGQTAVSKS